MGAGVDRTITLLRLAQGSLHTGRGVPRGHQGSRGQWPGDGSRGASAADLSGHHTDHRHPCTDGLIAEFASSFSQKDL